jgi:hypothetical protein
MGIVLGLLCAAPAGAAPVSGAHGTIDSQLTTTEPGAPSGFHYTGRYHATGDPQGDPPYMRKMVSYAPPGQRFDTSVPARCTASDLELALRGAAACPPASRLGGGTADGKFMGSTTRLVIDLFNNAGEQVMVARSPLVATITRGTIHPDGSTEFAAPTCYPAISPAGCPVDDVLQLGSDIAMEPYVRGGASYLTTPPTCPAQGFWDTPVRFWWADGAVETIVTHQPCAQP